MTTLLNRPVPGSGTHALIIGVGSYPNCKPGKGVDSDLRAVPDIPSAADSAKLMCDWLIENQDALSAPLASLEVLISEAPYGANQKSYPWVSKPGGSVDAATSTSVKTMGLQWVERLKARPGDVALFYACGHGARRGGEPILFLSDLNTDPTDAWGAYVNLADAASGFKQLQPIKAAFFFVDACQEFSPKFELMNTGGGVRFVPPLNVFKLDEAREKVALLSATASGLKAYDGAWSEDAQVKLGRFTQTLRLALDGASVRSKGGKWVVYPGSVFEDIKLLYRLRPDWRDRPFEPTQPFSPNEFYPIVNAPNPRVPILILTQPPQAMANYDVRIFANPDRLPPIVDQRQARSPMEWLAWVGASRLPHFAVAESGAEVHQEMFMPDSPIFDQRITIS